MTNREPDELEAELDALSAELAHARSEIEALKEAVHGIDPGRRDAVVTVDRLVRVSAVVSWPWTAAPTVGAPFADGFEERSASAIAQAAARGWNGIEEHRLALGSGRAVSLTARPLADGGYRLGVHDDTMSALLDQATEQRRRMRAVSQLAGTLARELTDPMSIVEGRLELLLDLGVTDPATVQRHLGVALEHSRRVTATLRNLRLVGRTADPPAEPIQFRRVVEEVLDLLGPRAARVLVRLVPEDLAIGCEAALPARVCASLARQALEATSRASIQLAASRSRAQRVVVRIGPSGRAVDAPASELDDLALDRTLLASVGGSLVARRVGSAPQFELTLPAPPSTRSRRRSLRGRLLVVGRALDAVPTLLDRDGYLFVQARTADQAIAHLEQTECEAVIAELLLEGSNSGLALAEIVGRRFANVRVILVVEGDDPPVLRGSVVPLRWPASRAELLTALGHRVRH